MALDRRRIITEALALLDAEGFENVTLRKPAARLGVQAPTLYWHIPNKAALKGFDMAAFAAAYPTVMAGVTEHFAPGRTVDDLFRECASLIVDGFTAPG